MGGYRNRNIFTMDYKQLKAFLKEKCVICHEKINFNKDKYVKLTDYNGKKKENQCYYHLVCWKDRMRIAQEKAMQEFVAPLLNKIQEIKNVQ